MRNQFLQGLDLPPVVANRTLPLDEQLRIKQEAEVARNVHTVLTGSISIPTTAVLMSSMMYTAVLHANLCDHFSAMFWAIIAPINNIAIMEIKDAYDLLKNTRYFKRDIKRNAKMTMQRIEKYDNAVISNMKQNLNGDRSQYWMDYTDEHYESIRHDLDIFYLSVLQVLTKFDEEEREAKARLVTSHALLNYAIGMFDAYFQRVEEDQHVSMANLYTDARLGYVMSSWSEVVDAICITRKPMDVDNDPNVKLAFRVIETHLIDMDRISEIGGKAIAYNPDVTNDAYHDPLNTDDNFSASFTRCLKNIK